MVQRSFLFQIPGQDNFYNFDTLMKMKRKPKTVVPVMFKNNKVSECLGKMPLAAVVAKFK